VVQQPGDFILTFPFALHSGGNLGNNLAVASNFGDPDWAEQAIYAPVCSCKYVSLLSQKTASAFFNY